jgi:transposase
VKLTWADGAYAGKLVTWAKTSLALTFEIVRRPDDLHTFQVLPRRWVVERTRLLSGLGGRLTLAVLSSRPSSHPVDQLPGRQLSG